MYSSSMLLLRDIYFKVNFYIVISLYRYIVPIILIVKKTPILIGVFMFSSKFKLGLRIKHLVELQLQLYLGFRFQRDGLVLNIRSEQHGL